MSEENNGAPEGVTEETAAAPNADAADQTNQPGEDAAAAADEGEAQPKPKKTAQDRIDELTRARREAERDRDFYREQALRAQQPEARREEARPEPAPEDAEPDPADYEHGDLDARFIRDHATFHARQTFRQELARTQAEEANRRLKADFDAKAKALAIEAPDFDEVVGEGYSNVAKLLTPVMGTVLTNSDDGPKLAYHLAKNPAEARRIAALPDLAQATELGKLSVRLSAPAKAIPKTATDAPEPPPQARGAGGRFTVAPDTDDFSAFEKQYGP